MAFPLQSCGACGPRELTWIRGPRGFGVTLAPGVRLGNVELAAVNEGILHAGVRVEDVACDQDEVRGFVLLNASNAIGNAEDLRRGQCEGAHGYVPVQACLDSPGHVADEILRIRHVAGLEGKLDPCLGQRCGACGRLHPPSQRSELLSPLRIRVLLAFRIFHAQQNRHVSLAQD